jgi:hypothetical protein
MSTIPLFRMTSPQLNRDVLQRAAEAFRLGDKVAGSDDAIAVNDDARVLVRAGACARFAGVLLYVNHRAALGAIYEKPIDPEPAGRWLGEFLEKHSLGPGKVDGRPKLETLPWARVTEAVVFDGKERRRVRARTDAGVRFRLNGLAISGPRTRIRAVFGNDELPIMLHVAVWERLEHYADAELVRSHDVVATLERSIRGRTDCNLTIRIKDIRLVYSATEEFHGSPDLLAPYYLLELQSPYRGSKGGNEEGPMQLLKIPAWRFATQSDWPIPAEPH